MVVPIAGKTSFPNHYRFGKPSTPTLGVSITSLSLSYQLIMFYVSCFLFLLLFSHVFQLVRRGVKSIVMFCNYQGSLATREEYDPRERDPVKGDIADDFSSFFGFPFIPFLNSRDDHRNMIFDQVRI